MLTCCGLELLVHCFKMATSTTTLQCKHQLEKNVVVKLGTV